MEIEIEKAHHISTPEGHQLAIVALWKDKHVTVCSLPEAETDFKKAICYTSRAPEGERLYYMALSWFSALVPGAKVEKVAGD